MKEINLTYVVDDDDIALLIARKLLDNNPSFKYCQTFSSPQNCLENIHQKIKTGEPLPDVILLDINMPVMDGWEFLDKIKEIEQMKNTLICMFTSSIDHRDRELCKAYPNIIGFITKPLMASKLDDLILNIENFN